MTYTPVKSQMIQQLPLPLNKKASLEDTLRRCKKRKERREKLKKKQSVLKKRKHKLCLKDHFNLWKTSTSTPNNRGGNNWQRKKDYWRELKESSLMMKRSNRRLWHCKPSLILNIERSYKQLLSPIVWIRKRNSNRRGWSNFKIPWLCLKVYYRHLTNCLMMIRLNQWLRNFWGESSRN